MSGLSGPFDLLSNCNQHDKIQLFAKFKKILRRGFKAALNFRKFKVALNPLCRILSYKRLKLKLRVFLAGCIVPMVTYCATQLTATRSSMIGQFVDTMILASTNKERLK